MHKINQTPSMRFTMKSTCLSITLAGVLLGSLLATAGAAVTKTRFDLNRSQTFKQSRVDQKPRVTEALFERWVGVPPWHQEVIGLTIPGTTIVTTEGPKTQEDDLDLRGESNSASIILIGRFNPQRSYDGSDDDTSLVQDHGNIGEWGALQRVDSEDHGMYEREAEDG